MNTKYLVVRVAITDGDVIVMYETDDWSVAVKQASNFRKSGFNGVAIYKITKG